MVELHQIAAALYLAAGVGALLAAVLPAPRMSRGAVWGTALALVVHAVAFAGLHLEDPVPPLTELPAALSFMAWIGNLFLLGLLWRYRVVSLVSISGPVSFLAVFYAALRLPHPGESLVAAAGWWSHAHVLLASAGLALLGLAGFAGIFFLVEHGRLKAKRPLGRGLRLPSLEALDRVNRVALALGFALLTLGVVTGMMWLQGAVGTVWSGSAHETWSAVAWGLYAGLAAARFAGQQGARQAAASAVAGFGFLLFAVVGVGFLA
ncbi:MAG: cytochrome c biogenesis protein [Proteobacteria bacterium]|nr:cytochrome c biogenesis protein [Pseudomonadota bacterium]